MNSPTTSPASIEKDLDAELSKLQDELRSLQSHRQFLTSSLLSSRSLQSRLQHLQPSATGPSPGTAADGGPGSEPDTPDISPLAAAVSKHNSGNHHRIAFTATTFPFDDRDPGFDDNHNHPDRDNRNRDSNGRKANDHDNQNSSSHHPSPNRHNQNRLLGIRLDICGRNGRFSRPYYLLLKRISTGSGEDRKRVKIHRHTIPGFISVRDLERVYLPVPVVNDDNENMQGEEAEAEDMLKPWKKKQKQGGAKKQDLRGLVRELRKELVAWQLRRDVLDLLRERLGFVREGEMLIDGGGELAERLGIVSLTAMGLDARYFRIQWADGRIGRLRISNTGAVMRAVVIKDSGRDKLTEVAIVGGDARVEGLLERLMGLTS